MADDLAHLEEERRRHERPVWLHISLGVLGTLGGVVLIFLMLGWMLHRSTPAPNVPPDPEVPSREAVRKEVRAYDRTMLTTYGWVDREKGVVRIPIEAAMTKLIEERERGR